MPQPSDEVMARTRRPRRSSSDLRHAILDHARQLFAQNGYQGVSTRTIAAAADASESLIFTNWGNKGALFRAAVLEPFQEFITAYQEQWGASRRTASLEQEARAYIEGLYDLLSDHRKLVLALVAAEAFEREALDGRIHEVFDPVLKPIVALVTVECERRGWTTIDPSIITRSMFGMVMSAAVLDDVLYPLSARPGREASIDQMTLFWVGAMRNAGGE